MKKESFALAGALALILAAPVGAQDLPGTGTTVRMAQPTWDTEWFQAQIYRALLQELGYTVDQPVALDNPPFYQAVAQGDVDFWASGWFPLHNTYLGEIEGAASRVGMVARGGALQGYLIDRATAEAHDIRYIEQLRDPDIAALFDADGDGKADLVACPPGWGCELTITHQMEAYDLNGTVNQIQAAYSASMADAVARHQAGEPILFYTWTPNWTVGELKPGEDVVWLQVQSAALPDDQKDMEDFISVEGVVGCADDPCVMGWPANDIEVVANDRFLSGNPAAAALLAAMSIPLADIFAQNAEMNAGASRPEEIEAQAHAWIEAHRDLVDDWIASALAAAN
ncbi:MAG: glycine betaine/L-proline ABC transporter substrate-binding protein ProX [Gemmobacter sp.]